MYKEKLDTQVALAMIARSLHRKMDFGFAGVLRLQSPQLHFHLALCCMMFYMLEKLSKIEYQLLIKKHFDCEPL